MSTSAASLALPTLSFQPQSHCYSRQVFFSPNSISSSSSSSSSLSLRLNSKPISIAASVLHPSRACPASSSRLVSNVAVFSEFEQEEEIFSDGDEPSYSPDLKLFVGNLPFSVDSAQLAELFESAGNVETVEVIYDKMTGRSRGFGFVTMSTAEEVEAATQQFNGYELEGRALRVNFGPSAATRENSSNRVARGGAFSDSGNRGHVSNLAWAVDNLALDSLFGEQGKVLEARIIYDMESGRSRGFGFVTYSGAGEVNSAIESLNGVDLNGRPIRVSLANVKPKRQF